MVTHSKEMIAPCGMNCTYCYVHHKQTNPCKGCRMNDNDKPSSCLKCNIKKCVMDKALRYCYECTEYPCSAMKRLDRSYETRYQESLITKLKMIKTKGVAYYLEKERERLKCPECGHELNLHDKRCYQCSGQFEVEPLK